MKIAAISYRFHRALLLLAALFGASVESAQAQYAYSQDGSEVTDNRTGLIWRRCSEGQTFSAGTCTGTALSFSHEAALARAKTQAGWRLPNVKELASIADLTRSQPAIDLVAFPATPSMPYWSSTPCPGDAGAYVWTVGFGIPTGNIAGNNGAVGQAQRYLIYNARLVR